MRIEKIRLFNFRNYEETKIDLHPGMNVFFGKNGSGKTNILEAVHFCAVGKSHRTSVDHETVMNGKDEAACEAVVKDSFTGYEISVRIKVSHNIKKEVYINRERVSRLSELMGKLPSVIFSPEDLDLIKEGPSVRRRFINILICQLRPDYFIALQQYQTALEHRNAILRQIKNNNGRGAEMLGSFEEILAEKAETIIPVRDKYIKEVSENAKNIYRRISGQDSEELNISYRSELHNADSVYREMTEHLRNSRENDIRYGCTLFGPHRDDILTQLGNSSMKAYASQGQARTAALSMKIAQLHIYEKEIRTAPLLMLDDVMSELDRNRKNNLMEEISKVQTLITCADEKEVILNNTGKCFYVNKNDDNGSIEESYLGDMTQENVSRETLNNEYFFL